MNINLYLPTHAVPPLCRHQFSWVFTDALVLARRSLLHIPRSPEELLSLTAQPILFVLLFRYIFGGAINVGGLNYVDYLMAGIFVQTVTFTSMATGTAFAADLEQGLIARVRSLPIARSVVLTGHTLAGFARTVFVLIIMLAVGLLVGFRPHGTLLDDLAGVGLLLLFSFAISWLGVTLAILVNNREAVQNLAQLLVFPLTFLSSAFVPTRTMPAWLQVFADHQPLTAVMNTVRSLALGLPVGSYGWQALAWSLGIIVVIVPIAVSAYQRAMRR